MNRDGRFRERSKARRRCGPPIWSCWPWDSWARRTGCSNSSALNRMPVPMSVPIMAALLPMWRVSSPPETCAGGRVWWSGRSTRGGERHGNATVGSWAGPSFPDRSGEIHLLNTDCIQNGKKSHSYICKDRSPERGDPDSSGRHDGGLDPQRESDILPDDPTGGTTDPDGGGNPGGSV